MCYIDVKITLMKTPYCDAQTITQPETLQSPVIAHQAGLEPQHW